MLIRDRIDTPLGTVLAVASSTAVCGLVFEEEQRDALDAHLARWWPGEPVVAGELAHLRETLARYFAGGLDALVDVAVDLRGTVFQRGVWTALRRIPSGETWTYRQLANRVVPASGGTGGYAGGVDRKAWLLAHEQRMLEARTRIA